jgi:hypothetical protein
MTTIGEVISRVRNLIKATKQDAVLTDRFLFSLISKHAHWLVKREDSKNKIMSFSSVMQTLDFMQLEEVDRVEAQCIGLKTNCIIKRTCMKVPAFMDGYFGPLIRAVKYNKTKYYWYLNDYLYFPDLDWDAVRVEGVFEEDITSYNCDTCDDCTLRTEQSFNVPDYLHAEMESNVMKDLGIMLQIPPDIEPNKQNILR